MKTTKKLYVQILCTLLCLLLLLSAVPMSGVLSVSANSLSAGLYLKGNMNGWNCYDEYKFVDNGNGIYTLVLDMTGGNYEFKIATPNWSTSIGDAKNDDDNAHLVIEADSIVKFTANTGTRDYTAEIMNTKSDFTLSATKATTIEAEKYTFALGAVSVLSNSKVSAGKYVGDFGEGDSLNYGVTVPGKEAVTYRFEINVASETDDGYFCFNAGENISNEHFSSTGAWQTYKTVVITKTLKPGYNRITIDNIGGTYNVDKITVSPANTLDEILAGVTNINFTNFDGASDASLVKNGLMQNADEGEYVIVNVKPAQDGVYTVSVDSAATKKGGVIVLSNGVGETISEENPEFDIVLEGETELMVFADKNDVSVSNIKLVYKKNIEPMGYLIFDYDSSETGYRFKNTFDVESIVITAAEDVPEGKLILSGGKEIAVEAIAEGEERVVDFENPESLTWFVFKSESMFDVELKVMGAKDMTSADDIALEGYVSTNDGWVNAREYPYQTTTATEGKLGFGFDREVTVDKVVFVGLEGVETEMKPVEPTTAPTAPATTVAPTEPSATATTVSPTETVTGTVEATEPSSATVPATSAPVTTVPHTTPTESIPEKTEPSSTAQVTEKSILLGDADLNEKVNVKDATLIQKHAAKIVSLVGDGAIASDVNADNKINVKDATAIQKYAAKMAIDYPIGEYVIVKANTEAVPQLAEVSADTPTAPVTEIEVCKAKLTTADNKTVEVEGVVQGNDVVFELDDTYSFGFYFDFGTEVSVKAIQVYGDTEYKGGSVNVSDKQDYTLFVNGLTENDSRVIANTGTHILTSETGSDREWEYDPFIVDEAPTFYAPNTPLAEAAYNLTMEEIFKSINYDQTYGDVFYTGTNWHKVWTRDTAISMQYILSWLFPEISTNCAEAKVVGKDGNLTFEEDTGTGGSYPVSTDRIIMMLAVWETYLADGNLETLEYFYEVASNTIMQDYEVVYDSEAGLFRGETCGLDHRDKTYGDWTGEDDENGIVTIAEGKAASTNIIFCQAMKILSQAAEILGKGEAEAKAWADLAADLEKAISDRLWLEDLGTYTSWEYPDWMGSPLAYKQDVLANGYAVWYNIGGQEKADSIMENHTLVEFGANTVYPQKNAERWTDYKYHDSGVWPGWEAILMIGAVNNENENNLLAEEIWNSCIRGAAACLTNYEVIDYETGEGLHSTQQLWSVAATMAGYFRVLYGMEYTTEGITFDPYVPQWMEGPFYVDNYKYRNANLSLELNGKGDTVESIYVNGEQVENDYVLPVDANGDYSITITVTDSGAEDIINLKDENTAKAPNAPKATLTGTTLKWNAVKNCTYKVWTGTEYVDVNTTSYTIDNSVYGCYSVVAVDKSTGLWSELSKPIAVSPAGSNVTVNVGDKLNTATFTVNIPVDGEYQLSSIHTNQGDPTAGITAAIRSVYVDGKDVGTLVFPAMSNGHQLSSHLRLTLKAGEHEVTVKYGEENWYDRNMSNAHGQSNNNVTYHMFQFALVDGAFDEITPPEKKTIYFSNNKNWSKVNIFFWGGSDSTTWPGTAMEYVGLNENGEKVYKYELDPSTPNIIFNNGTQQTVDIKENVEDGKGFYLLNETDGEGKFKVGVYDYEG